MIIRCVKSLKGTLQVPGDKSISHRSVMFGALSQGTTEITNFLEGADCLSTISCFRSMGIVIEHTKGSSIVVVQGKGLHGLRRPEGILDVGNSGTTMRLMSGILCGQTFETSLTGDASIQKRPMGRVIEPLTLMGANIKSITGGGLAPLTITPVTEGLHGIHYTSKVASAQVKSAILLAGLYANDPTSVTEPYLSRNHTEIMLKRMGADIKVTGTTAVIQPGSSLSGDHIEVPGDISSAAYFIAAGLLVPNSEILIKNVGINPTRDGILRVCKAMGAKIELMNIHNTDSEATADILVSHSPLKAVEIGGDIIPTLIDEIPIIAVMACFAEGTTVIKDAAELKVKESNRIDVMVKNLTLMGADIQGTEDGMIIKGGKPLKGCTIDSMEDHRIAMSFAIAGLLADGETTILNENCVDISYPGFYEDIYKLN